VLRPLRRDLGDARRSALCCTSMLSTMLQLTRCCLVVVGSRAGDCRIPSESWRVRAVLDVRADYAGGAERGAADAGAVRCWRRLRSNRLEELRALGSMAVEGPIARCQGSELCRFRSRKKFPGPFS
jgi:hypothetical protein